MPFLDEVVSGAPKSLKNVMWVLCVIIGFTCFGGWVGAKIQNVAEAETIPLDVRITKLEAGQAKLWETINTQLAQISQAVAVLSEHVKDTEKGK